MVPGTQELGRSTISRILFMGQTRFSLTSDSERIHIWEEREKRNYSCKFESDHFEVAKFPFV